MPPHRRFKSYPLAGVFRLAGEIHVVLDRFKSYPLVGVFQTTTGAKNGRTMFQVIPPCGGIPPGIHADRAAAYVSSHTPLRGYSRLR